MNDLDMAKLEALMMRYGIGRLDYMEGNERASLTIAGAKPVMVAAEPPPVEEDRIVVRAEATGLFLARHPASVDEIAFPRRVQKGDIVGWLKAGHLLRPVVAPAPGIVGPPIVAEGTLIGYGDRIF